MSYIVWSTLLQTPADVLVAGTYIIHLYAHTYSRTTRGNVVREQAHQERPASARRLLQGTSSPMCKSLSVALCVESNCKPDPRFRSQTVAYDIETGMHISQHSLFDAFVELLMCLRDS